MTAENPLTGLVPLGYQLGDSADHARYVDSDIDVPLGQPIVLTYPTKSKATIGVPFCSARQSLLFHSFLVLSSYILQDSEDMTSTFFWRGWQRTCGGNSQGANSYAVISTHMDMVVVSLVLLIFCFVNDIQWRYDSACFDALLYDLLMLCLYAMSLYPRPLPILKRPLQFMPPLTERYVSD
jgi:hypothetical protein